MKPMSAQHKRWAAIALLVTALPTAASGQSLFKDSKKLLDKLTGPSSSNQTLSNADIATGLKEALRVGSESVVKQLGTKDGFNADKAIHIPLPKSLRQVKEALGRVGLDSMLSDLELKLNRGAEKATGEVKKLFLQSVDQMSLDDARRILNGPDDAATQYFRRTMNKPLRRKMRPIVSESLTEVGALKAYDDTMASYRKLPLVPDVKSDLVKHVLDKGMDGIFHYIAKEEAAIRKNPVKRTTDILKQVFGAS